MAKRKRKSVGMSPSAVNDAARRMMALAAENTTPQFKSAVSRTAYSQLFTLIGKLFGKGDGSTTFNVPDLRGRTKIGG